MALNRSPANMETEDGEKLQLILWLEVSRRGGEDQSEFISHSVISDDAAHV